MASHVFVVDSSARRYQIKTTPNKYLRDILEEACQKFGKDPAQFSLSDTGRNPKSLDQSLTVRLAGLVNGAKLQLVQASRSPSVISIALQLPETLGGGRLQDRFPSNTSLWLVLRKFEEAVAGEPPKKLNITQRGVPSTENGAGRLEYEQPVLTVMNRELKDFVDLQKTLMQLGFNSGSVLLRLSFRQSGTAMEDAMKQITEYFSAAQGQAVTGPAAAGSSAETRAANGAHAGSVGNLSSVPDVDSQMKDAPGADQAGPEPSEDTVMTPPPAESRDMHPFEDTGVIASSSETVMPSSNPDTEASTNPPQAEAAEPKFAVYRPSSNTVPEAALQAHNESDFEPTVEHAQSHQNTLLRASQNRRLQSDAELEEEKQKRQQSLATIKSATIRIRCPDQMQVDVTVTPSETASSLYQSVRDMLERPEQKFELRYTGPKGAPVTIKPEGQQKLIADLGMSGRVLVTMVWDSSVGLEGREPVLKGAVRSQAVELKVPVPEGVSGFSTGKGKMAEGKAEPVKKEGGKGDLEAKMKKFLGFKKK